MDEAKCQQIGKLQGERWERMHDLCRRVYSADGLSPTIPTMGGGHQDPKIVEPSDYRFYRQAIETLQENDCEAGDTIDAYNRRVNKDGVSPALTTRPDGFKTAILPVVDDDDQDEQDGEEISCGVVGEICGHRIRKLTPRECFRLMGVKREDYERAAHRQSVSSQYHLAGDSIVTACLMAIFGELLSIDYDTKINELTEELLDAD
ncbi:MAG: DNA cytosine methyltransferase [Roseburia sp.]|nr:DNA cytosine methyltransferase [Roseburia sp.]